MVRHIVCVLRVGWQRMDNGIEGDRKMNIKHIKLVEGIAQKRCHYSSRSVSHI